MSFTKVWRKRLASLVARSPSPLTHSWALLICKVPTNWNSSQAPSPELYKTELDQTPVDKLTWEISQQPICIYLETTYCLSSPSPPWYLRLQCLQQTLPPSTITQSACPRRRTSPEYARKELTTQETLSWLSQRIYPAVMITTTGSRLTCALKPPVWILTKI